MKRFLLLVITLLALPTVVNANEKVPFKMTETEANRMLLGQVLSTCYGVSRNHITMKQRIEMLGFAMNFHAAANLNQVRLQKSFY